MSAKNGLAGQTCGDLLRGAKNTTLLGVRRSSGAMVVAPATGERLAEGDIVIVMATEGDIAGLRSRAALT